MNSFANTSLETYPDRISIACELDGARFHIWTNRDLVPHDDTVYKNIVRVEGEAHINTRRLDRNKGQGKLVYQHLVESAPALLPAAISKERAKADADEVEHVRLCAEKLAKEAGPELLAALKLAQVYAEAIKAETLTKTSRLAEENLLVKRETERREKLISDCVAISAAIEKATGVAL